jgi:hypothetical protein
MQATDVHYVPTPLVLLLNLVPIQPVSALTIPSKIVLLEFNFPVACRYFAKDVFGNGFAESKPFTALIVLAAVVNWIQTRKVMEKMMIF